MANREDTAIGIFEQDTNDDILCVWNFPGIYLFLYFSINHVSIGISPLIQSLCIRKLNNEGNGSTQFFFKYKNDWIYINTLPALSDITPDVTKVSVCLVSKIFNPEKYHSLIEILIEQYVSTGDPTKLLEGRLFISQIDSKYS